MQWAIVQTRHRSRVLVTVAYLSTLIAIVVVSGMAWFQPVAHDVRKPPALIDSEVSR